MWDKKRVEAAKRYALADKSDPFAFSRAMAHMQGRVVGFTDKGRDAFYDAEKGSEERITPAGEKYNAVVYRNCVRP